MTRNYLKEKKKIFHLCNDTDADTHTHSHSNKYIGFKELQFD